ncbi:S41 family peptidase [Roseomonas elaeocarpi]|uniref:S41 family peptidase n=1 Tax=Roseomonas elaeocarpi TaxID=907779 RepID=A0ABV6JXZ8_9PROT
MAAQARPEAFFPRTLLLATLQAGFNAVEERHLEAAAPADLALWGARGLVALDPTLDVELQGDAVRLVRNGREVARRAIGNGSAGAAEALVWLFGAAWDVSPPVRQAGSDGLLEATFDEIFNHLDPYSRYLSANTADTARDRRMGTVGVGLVLENGDDGVRVAEVLPDSPALAAGLRAGDLLTGLNRRSLRSADSEAVSALLDGAAGSSVRLNYRRGRQARTALLRRAQVAPVTVRAEQQGDLLLLRITAFSADTAGQLAEALTTGLARNSLRGVVLDLRGNRGGLLREAVAVLEELVPSGLLVSTDGRHPDARRRFEGRGDDLAQDRPIAVLVDGRTASSAEIVAAALSDRGRGVVIGSATMGKGLIQVLMPLPNGGELSLSWSRVLAPDGWPVQSLGVIPALCTSLGAENTSLALERLERGEAPMGAVLKRLRAARAPVLASEVVALRDSCPPAEARESDLQVATALLDHPEAYRAALPR